MTQKSSDSDGIVRRKFLRNAGAVAGGLLATSVPAAARMTEKERIKQSERKTYERLLRKREKHDWTIEQFRNALRETGAVVKTAGTAVKLSGKHGQNVESVATDEEGISTQNIAERDMRFNLTLTSYRFTDIGDLHWSWNTNSFLSYGDRPWDYPSLAFLSDEYDLEGHYPDTNDLFAWERDVQTGVAFRFNDNKIGSGEQGSATCGVYLGDRAPGVRHLYAGYRHTWDTVEIESVTLGYGTIDITFTDGTDVWKQFLNTEV